jgi:hypothetical protein
MIHLRCCRRLLVLLPFLAVVTLAIPGCPGERTARVSGKVTYKDQPVTGGQVVFANEDNTKVERVPIDNETGAYSSSHVPYGKLRVAVEPAGKPLGAFIPKDKGKIPKDTPGSEAYSKSSGTYVDIPGMYRSPETSRIEVTIDSPEKTFDISLKEAKQ